MRKTILRNVQYKKKYYHFYKKGTFFWKNCVTSPRAARLGTAVPKFIIDMVYVYDSYNDSYDESLYYSSYESSYES